MAKHTRGQENTGGSTVTTQDFYDRYEGYYKQWQHKETQDYVFANIPKLNDKQRELAWEYLKDKYAPKYKPSQSGFAKAIEHAKSIEKESTTYTCPSCGFTQSSSTGSCGRCYYPRDGSITIQKHLEDMAYSESAEGKAHAVKQFALARQRYGGKAVSV